MGLDSITEQRLKFIIEKRQENWTYAKIANVLGITRQRVYQLHTQHMKGSVVTTEQSKKN